MYHYLFEWFFSCNSLTTDNINNINTTIKTLEQDAIILFKNIQENSTIYLYENKIYKVFMLNNYTYKNYISLVDSINNNTNLGILIPEKRETNPNNYTIIETYKYYPNSDLFYILTTNKLNKDDKFHIIKLLILAVKKFHNDGYAHRDLKLENILFVNDDLYLIDIVMSSSYNCTKSFNGGTPHYAAPELLDRKHIDDWRKTDIWSLGMIIFIISRLLLLIIIF